VTGSSSGSAPQVLSGIYVFGGLHASRNRDTHPHQCTASPFAHDVHLTAGPQGALTRADKAKRIRFAHVLHIEPDTIVLDLESECFRFTAKHRVDAFGVRMPRGIRQLFLDNPEDHDSLLVGHLDFALWHLKIAAHSGVPREIRRQPFERRNQAHVEHRRPQLSRHVAYSG
jgi:hypothetical protein